MKYAEEAVFNSIWYNKILISNRALQYWFNNGNKKSCIIPDFFLLSNLSHKHPDLQKVTTQPHHYWAQWQKYIKKPQQNKAFLILVENTKQRQPHQPIHLYTKCSIYWTFHFFRTLNHLACCHLPSPSGLTLIKNLYPKCISLMKLLWYVFYRSPWCQPLQEFIPFF